MDRRSPTSFPAVLLAPAGAEPHGRALRRRLGRGLGAAVLAYAGLVGLLFAGQEWLIFPGRGTQGRAASGFPVPPDCELVHLRTASGERVAALFGPALHADGRPHPAAARQPMLLYFYGNGTTLRTALPQFEAFRRLGANVLVPEYVGYGLSSGAAGEAGCYATADAAYAHLLARDDVDPGRIVAVGTSLGGAVAIDLAAREEVAGLATFSTFSSLPEVARRQYPVVPAALLRHRFESEAKMRRVRCPVLLGHGESDRLVPASMCDDLAGACAAPVTQVRVAGAGHSDLFVVGGDQVLAALEAFMARL